MSNTVISVENVSKAYRLGQIGGGTLKEDFARWWAKLLRKPDPFLKIGEEHHARKMGEQFWALDNVSFEVKEGEVLGIIGRNGAGKSTLLKILSQVTTPTSGRIKIKGRIASLLEVGTGFNPEMTGRENVFLNGAILGMTKAEIRKKFDEIVAFSGVEEFIDTPVKRYSSGMYVRLAFAVAAHLEPEILIVDEVLAVGDAEFQKKCLGKMEDASRGGRTILFVSHNMTTMKSLCSRIVLLGKGKILFDGATEKGIEHYNQSLESFEKVLPIRERPRDAGLAVRAMIVDVSISNESGNCISILKSDESFVINLAIDCKSTTRFGIYIVIRDSQQVLIWMDSGHLQSQIFTVKPGSYCISCKIEPTHLASGNYTVDCGLTLPDIEWVDFISQAISFSIREYDPYQSGFNLSQRFARYHVPHTWSLMRAIDKPCEPEK